MAFRSYKLPLSPRREASRLIIAFILGYGENKHGNSFFRNAASIFRLRRRTRWGCNGPALTSTTIYYSFLLVKPLFFKIFLISLGNINLSYRISASIIPTACRINNMIFQRRINGAIWSGSTCPSYRANPRQWGLGIFSHIKHIDFSRSWTTEHSWGYNR